jgi:hypothetical protein
MTTQVGCCANRAGIHVVGGYSFSVSMLWLASHVVDWQDGCQDEGISYLRAKVMQGRAGQKSPVMTQVKHTYAHEARLEAECCESMSRGVFSYKIEVVLERKGFRQIAIILLAVNIMLAFLK